MLNHKEIDYPTFKMIIQSLPEEPEIKEHNYFEEYLEEKRRQEEQARANGQHPVQQSQIRGNPSRIQPSLAGSRSPVQPVNHSQQLQFIPANAAQSRLSNAGPVSPGMGKKN